MGLYSTENGFYYGSNLKRIDQLARCINDNSGFVTADTVEGLAADKGYGFCLNYHSSSLSAGSTQYIQITTSTDATVAIKEETLFSGGADLIIELFENPVFSTGTAAIEIHNRQRRLVLGTTEDYSAKTLAFSDPTGVSSGTLLFSKYYYSAGIGGAGDPVSNNFGIGWQLGKGHDYIYRIQNIDATSTARYVFSLAIYELPEERE